MLLKNPSHQQLIEKADAIIDSCVTLEQLAVAEKYCERLPDNLWLLSDCWMNYVRKRQEVIDRLWDIKKSLLITA